MSYEIVYTSSESGLKPGEKGFCTVGATKGIAPTVLSLLESLSGYRHKKEPGHPENPVVYAHLLLKSGESILSRVADAGLDYSKRSNKIAHHLVLPAMERPAAGPSRTMAHPETMYRGWEGEARFLQPRKVSAADELIGKCSSWAALTGDAGWAAALADTATGVNKREAYILYRPGTDCLRLIDEALSLLPSKERWQVTFSTFFTKNQAMKSSCQWRFIQKGEPEEKEIPLHASVFKLDLTSSLGPVPDLPLAQQARTGERPAKKLETAKRSVPTTEEIGLAETADPGRRSKKQSDGILNIPRQNPPSPRQIPPLNPRRSGSPSLESSPFHSPAESWTPPRNERAKKTANKLLALYGLCIGLVLGSLIGVGATVLVLRADQFAQLPGGKDGNPNSEQSMPDENSKVDESNKDNTSTEGEATNVKEEADGDGKIATDSVPVNQDPASETPVAKATAPVSDGESLQISVPPAEKTVTTPDTSPGQKVESRPELELRIAKNEKIKLEFEPQSFIIVPFDDNSKNDDQPKPQFNKTKNRIEFTGDGLAGPTHILDYKNREISLPGNPESWKNRNSLLLVTSSNNDKLLCDFLNTVDIRFPAPNTERNPDPKTDFPLPRLSSESIQIESSTHDSWRKEQGKTADQTTDDPNKLIFTLECQAPNTAGAPQPQKHTGKIEVLLDPKEMNVSVKEQLPRMPPGPVDDPKLPTFEDLKKEPQKTEIKLRLTYKSADVNGEKYDVTLDVPLFVDIEALSQRPPPTPLPPSGATPNAQSTNQTTK